MTLDKNKKLLHRKRNHQMKIKPIGWEITAHYIPDKWLYPKYIKNSCNLIAKTKTSKKPI